MVSVHIVTFGWVSGEIRRKVETMRDYIYWPVALIGLLFVVLTMSGNHVIAYIVFMISFYLMRKAVDYYIDSQKG